MSATTKSHCYTPPIFSCQTYFQLSLFFVTAQSRTWRAKFCYFGGYMFSSICRTVLPNLVRIIRLIQQQIFHPKLIPFDNFVPSLASFTCRLSGKNQVAFFSIIAINVYFSSQASHAPANASCVHHSQTHAWSGSMCLMVVESIMAILLLPAFAASDVKHHESSHSCSNERSVCGLCSNFPYFSGISLHDRPRVFVTQLAQLMTTRAQIFSACWGLCQKFFKHLLNCLFEIRGISFQYPQ